VVGRPDPRLFHRAGGEARDEAVDEEIVDDRDRIAADLIFCIRGSGRVNALVFPKGAPPSTMDVLFAFIHFIHASIPSFRCSGVEFFIIFSNSVPVAIYNTKNFFIGSSFGLPDIGISEVITAPQNPTPSVS
jgi:hypothetical protein